MVTTVVPGPLRAAICAEFVTAWPSEPTHACSGSVMDQSASSVKFFVRGFHSAAPIFWSTIVSGCGFRNRHAMATPSTAAGEESGTTVSEPTQVGRSVGSNCATGWTNASPVLSGAV
jgi:hypothetical protein